MKRMLFLMSCVAILFAAPLAHAYAIYNSTDNSICVMTKFYYDINACKFRVDPHSHHNGAHGSGLDNVWFCWCDKDGKSCHKTTVPADIPKGGYAKVYNDTVKVYRHDGYYMRGYPFENSDMCGYSKK